MYSLEKDSHYTDILIFSYARSNTQLKITRYEKIYDNIPEKPNNEQRVETDTHTIQVLEIINK